MMFPKTLNDAKQMHAAMKALVGESPQNDVKNILGLEGNASVKLCCMIFEITPAQENRSETTCSRNMGIAQFSQENCTVSGMVPLDSSSYAQRMNPTTNALADDLRTFLTAAEEMTTLVMAQDPNSSKNTTSKIWIRQNLHDQLQPLDRHVLDALLESDGSGKARGCTVQELARQPIEAHAAVIQKVLAIVPEDQKTRIVKKLATCPAVCQTLCFSKVACFVVSQLQLEGLVCLARDDADDVFSPGHPTSMMDEYKAGLVWSALEFVASFVITDRSPEPLLKRCITDKHCNHTFCLWLQLLIRLVRMGTYVRSDRVVHVSDGVSRFASTSVRTSCFSDFLLFVQTSTIVSVSCIACTAL